MLNIVQNEAEKRLDPQMILPVLFDSTCFHGEWKCRTTAPCQQPKSRSCSVAVDSLGRTLQSDCPKGYWCKVQIPGIPEANIPEVAVCTPEHPTSMLTQVMKLQI